MKTAIYIDGFNLYYGVLKNTPYKWLNVHALCSFLLREQDPASVVSQCTFYTAVTMSRVASRGEASVQAQQVYHRALISEYMPTVNVVIHNHRLDVKPLIRFSPGTDIDKSDRVKVWVTTEKKTDVCLALDAYRAAASGKFDQIVIVSNDIDLEPALQAIRADFPAIRRGVIAPRRNSSGRTVARGFRDVAHWLRSHISNEELARHQFPDRVPTRKAPAVKPSHW